MEHLHEEQPVYFPREIFYRKNIKGEEYLSFSHDWFSKFLFAMQEPSLYHESDDIETYRLTWLRSFDNPIVIRIIKQHGTFTVILKLCNGRGGYDPGELVVNLSRTISCMDWEVFQEHLATIDFWSMETWEDIIGFDGAEWLLEGQRDGHYHLVSRWSPKERIVPYFQCCDYLIQLTGLVISDREKY